MRASDGSWRGIAVDLWERMAELAGLRFEYRSLGLAELLSALESGGVDVAVAALTITAEREKRFDYTHPFMRSGLAIATEVRPGGWWQTAKRFVSLPFLQAAGALAAVVLAFGVLMWLVEHRRNEEFGGSAVRGVGAGFWWSAVTMTTVGYGDKTPKTPVGRIVGLVWMFAAIIIISGFTAAIASSLTVDSLRSGVENLDDLRSAEVGVLAESSAAAFLSDERIRYREFRDIESLVDALESGAVDAAVHDAPILRFALHERNAPELKVLPQVLEPQTYAFGLDENSSLREPLNRALLEVTQGALWDDMLRDYLGDL